MACIIPFPTRHPRREILRGSHTAPRDAAGDAPETLPSAWYAYELWRSSIAIWTTLWLAPFGLRITPVGAASGLRMARTGRRSSGA